MSNQLAFNGTSLSVTNYNHQIWLSSSELSAALQYADDGAVTRIYNKHSDEFSVCMSTVVELTTSANLLTRQRIFSLRGAHLIAMFARTPVAKEFRKWVLDILDKEIGTAVIKSQETTHTLTVTDEEFCSLCWLWNISTNMSEFAKEIYPALKAINSRYAGRCYDIGSEFGYTQKQARKVLERGSHHIQDTPSLSRNWRTVLRLIRNN